MLPYDKVPRCSEKVLQYMRRSPKSSYCKQPSFLYLLHGKSQGTIHDFIIENGWFKYYYFCSWYIGVLFHSCGPVVYVDGTLLKKNYGGQLLCVVVGYRTCQKKPRLGIKSKSKVHVGPLKDQAQSTNQVQTKVLSSDQASTLQVRHRPFFKASHQP